MNKTEPQSDLKSKSTSAVLWSGADMFMRQGLQLIVTIILARLLSPEVFGTLALLYLFTGLATVFIDSGFSTALIQRQDITHTDESTVFWFNLTVGAMVSLMLWTTSPLIADFFGYPVLIPLAKVLALSLFLGALGSIHITLFSKQLNFRTPMKIGAISTLVSGAVAVYLAMNNYGIWALAAQTLIANLVSTSLLWIVSSWRPSFEISRQSISRLFGFGGFLLMASLLDMTYNRIYSLLIGKFYGVHDLGIYARADSTKQMPVEFLSNTLSRVIFPIFSTISADKEQLFRAARLALRGMMLINVPMMLGLMATAENVIYVVFGEKWLPAAPILQVLCLAAVFWPLHVVNLNVLNALGYSNLFFRLEVIKKLLGTLLLVIGVTYGVMGIAWSQVAYGAISFFINSYYTKKYIEYGTFNQLADLIPTVLLSATMAIAVYFFGETLQLPKYILLSLQVLMGISLMLILLYGFKVKAFADAISLIPKRDRL